ncbi:MAG: hypothetical protein AAF990_01930 [Bacteroidota bacterium]
MEQQEWIDRYLEGRLNEAELKEMERKLQQEPEFARALMLEKDLMEGIESFGNDRLRDFLDGVHEEVKSVPVQETPKSSRLIWVAAVALAVLLMLAFWLWPRPDSTPAELYALYKQENSYPFDFTEKSTDDEQALIELAERLLKKQDYKQALMPLNELFSKTEESQYLLAIGIAEMESEAVPNEAIATFRKLQQQYPAFQNDYLWYEALAHLKKEDVAAAQASLQKISNASKRYEVARALLDALDAN